MAREKLVVVLHWLALKDTWVNEVGLQLTSRGR